jgi:hypothetical protein
VRTVLDLDILYGLTPLDLIDVTNYYKTYEDLRLSTSCFHRKVLVSMSVPCDETASVLLL